MKARLASLLFLLLLAACQKKAPQPVDAHFQGTAMTMPYHIIIGQKIDSDQERLAADFILKTFQEIDLTFNNWNPSSEISRFNRAEANVKVPISERLFRALKLCQDIVHLSGGRFDPTVEPLCRLWREAFAQGKTPSSAKQEECADSLGWQHIAFEPGHLLKNHRSTSLDLCGIAKGICVDRLLEGLKEMGFPNLFVDWSGEIRAAGRPPSGNEWQVAVHPSLKMNGKSIPSFILRDAAMATSGDYLQKNWKLSTADGHQHHYYHIIDPLQAHPLEKTEYSIAAVCVMAPTCALADALSTAASVFSTRKEAESWAQEVVELYPQVSFWILSYDIKPKF